MNNIQMNGMINHSINFKANKSKQVKNAAKNAAKNVINSCTKSVMPVTPAFVPVALALTMQNGIDTNTVSSNYPKGVTDYNETFSASSATKTLQTQGTRHADEIVADIKKRTFTYSDGSVQTFEEFANGIPNKSEGTLLKFWGSITKEATCSTELKRNLEEVGKCIAPEGIRKIDVLKNLSEEELAIFLQDSDKHQIIPFLTGHKPSFYGCPAGVDFAKALKGTRYADEIVALADSAGKPFLLRPKQVKDIIFRNKEIYCRELNIDISSSVDDIYTKLINSISSSCLTEENPLVFGLTLGYPKFDTIFYQLKKRSPEEAASLLSDLSLDGAPGKMAETREKFVQFIYSKKSPFTNYSKEFLSEIEDVIRKSDFRTYLDLEERSFSQFKRYVLDYEDLRRVKALERDFITGFKMENLMS